VIAAGENVDAEAENLLGELRGDAESARRVLAVGDGQIDVFVRDDFTKMLRDEVAAG
jgi:hypothetical protein